MGAPITIQSNIKSNTKSFDKFGYFLGGIDVTHQNLDQFTPYIRGVSRIFLHKPPAFMLERFPDLTRRFKTYLETGFTSVDGISDISVDFTYAISKADKNPLYMEMTFNGMTAGEGDEQVTFSKFNMKMEYTNFDTVDAITVPQDVVDSAIDVTDYLNDLQNETSTETETQTESESAA